MINKELTWQGLLPDLTPYETILTSSATFPPSSLADIQPRLFDSMQRFVAENSRTRFMFIKADENEFYLKTFASAIEPLLTKTHSIVGDYQLSDDHSTLSWNNELHGKFSATHNIAWREWIEPEQLFGFITSKQQAILDYCIKLMVVFYCSLHVLYWLNL